MNVLTGFVKSSIENPLAVRDIRVRMRRGKASLLLFSYLLILSIIFFLTYTGMYTAYTTYGSFEAMGEKLFLVLHGFQIALITLVVPGLTAWLITSEHESETFDLLVGTLLSPLEIVWGKLLPALLFATVLLTASIPISILCTALGGVSAGMILKGYLGLGIYTFALGVIGLFCSSLFKKSFAAVIVSYLLSGGYCLFAVFGAEMAFQGNADEAVFALMMVPSWMLVFLELEFSTVQIFGRDISIYLLNGIPTILLSVIFMLLAAGNIPRFLQDYTRPLRILLLTHTSLLAAGLAISEANMVKAVGSMSSMSPDSLGLEFLILLFTVVTVPLLTAARFSKPGISVAQEIVQGLDPTRWTQNRMGGGFWFMALWFTLLFFVFRIVLLLASGSSMNWALTPLMFFVMLSILFSMAAFSIMLYVNLRDTAAARVASIATLVISMVVFTGLAISFDWTGNSPFETFFILPQALVMVVSNTQASEFWNDDTLVAIGWVASAVLHSVLGLAFLYLGGNQLKRQQKMDALPSPIIAGRQDMPVASEIADTPEGGQENA